MSTTTTLLSLTELENAYPSGFVSFQHGCYYIIDQDGELGYFIQYNDGKYEPELQYVDFDTLEDDVREHCELIAAHISFNY